MEGYRSRGILRLHPVERGPRQPIDDSRLFGDHRRRARNLPIEPHLTHHRVPNHASAADRVSLLVIDGNGDAARRKKLHRVGRLALPEEEAPYFELVALKEWDDPRQTLP